MKIILEENYLSYCIIIKKKEKNISDLHIMNNPQKMHF